jgi:hypothetical protein
MFYRYCDLVLRANTSLPELPPASETSSAIEFELLPPAELDPTPIEWFQRREAANGKVWLTSARQDRGYLLRFTVYADFMILDEGARVRAVPRPKIPLETIRHLLLDQVMPLVLSLRGGLIMHASAVATHEGAIAFVGDTGRGKSTLATSLTQRGHRLITDDCLVVREQAGQFMALPTYPGLRVFASTAEALVGPGPALPGVAHYTHKKRLGPDNIRLPFEFDAVPLRRVFFLDPPGHPSATNGKAVAFTPMPAHTAMLELIRTSVRLDYEDRARHRAEFEICKRLVRSTPLFRLAFVRNLARLPEVCEAILANSMSTE